MTKHESLAEAKSKWPAKKPALPGMFSWTSDGAGVIISVYDQPVTLVVYKREDLVRLAGFCSAAIAKLDA